jgi:hypothetical protein
MNRYIQIANDLRGTGLRTGNSAPAKQPESAEPPVKSIAWRGPQGELITLSRHRKNGMVSTFEDLEGALYHSRRFDPDEGEFGFVCAEGQFLSKEEASERAYETGQLHGWIAGMELCPVDIWEDQ